MSINMHNMQNMYFVPKCRICKIICNIICRICDIICPICDIHCIYVVYTRYIQPLGIYMVYTWYIPPDYIPRRGSRCMTLDVSCWHRGTAGPVTPWPGRFAAGGTSRPPPTRPGRGGHGHGHCASARPPGPQRA